MNQHLLSREEISRAGSSPRVRRTFLTYLLFLTPSVCSSFSSSSFFVTLKHNSPHRPAKVPQPRILGPPLGFLFSPSSVDSRYPLLSAFIEYTSRQTKSSLWPLSLFSQVLVRTPNSQPYPAHSPISYPSHPSLYITVPFACHNNANPVAKVLKMAPAALIKALGLNNLHAAVFDGDLKMVKRLIGENHDIIYTTSARHKMTALHFAVMLRKFPIACLLIRKEASLEFRDIHGRRPVQYNNKDVRGRYLALFKRFGYRQEPSVGEQSRHLGSLFRYPVRMRSLLARKKQIGRAHV